MWKSNKKRLCKEDSHWLYHKELTTSQDKWTLMLCLGLTTMTEELDHQCQSNTEMKEMKMKTIQMHKSEVF
jgi:hypothetical protein